MASHHKALLGAELDLGPAAAGYAMHTAFEAMQQAQAALLLRGDLATTRNHLQSVIKALQAAIDSLDGLAAGQG